MAPAPAFDEDVRFFGEKRQVEIVGDAQVELVREARESFAGGFEHVGLAVAADDATDVVDEPCRDAAGAEAAFEHGFPAPIREGMQISRQKAFVVFGVDQPVVFDAVAVVDVVHRRHGGHCPRNRTRKASVDPPDTRSGRS